MNKTARRAFLGAGITAGAAAVAAPAHAATDWTARQLPAAELRAGDIISGAGGATLRIHNKRTVGQRVRLTYTDTRTGRARRLGPPLGVRADRPFLVLARRIPTAAVRSSEATNVGADDTPLVYDVRDYGDFSPDSTWQQNRDALQAANNAAAAAGGGRVVIPAGGVYDVKGVRQDSHVHLDWSGATLRHPDGDTVDIIRSRTRTTTGSINAGTRTLEVADSTGVEPGCIIGIRGPAPASPLQAAALTTAITADATSIEVADVTGLRLDGFLRIDDEVISYRSITGNTLGDVTRGALGTTAAAHSEGTAAGYAMRLVTTVESVDGTTVTLAADPGPAADITVTDAAVSIGAIDLSVTGRIDGNRLKGGSTSTVNGVRYDLTRHWSATLTADRAEAALYATVAWDGTYDITANDCSVPEASKGACVWLFQQCHRNTGTLRAFGDLWSALYLDNRTTLATEWDGACDDNTGTVIIRAQKRTPWITNVGLLIVGGNRNHYKLIGSNVRTGLLLEGESQVVTPDGTHPPARGNVVDVLLTDVYQPWVLLEPGNVISGYYESEAAGVNTGNSLVAVASRATGGGPVVAVGSVSTAGRPDAAAAGAGATIYDTDLGRPLWSNGTAWTDATGEPV